MNNPSEGTSIEIVNPLNITSLIHRLFMFFILNSCCAIFFSALPNSLLYGKYGAQNEMYIEGWTEKGLNLLIYKRLCNI